ncbi:unnamed protein product, partial [Pylaiella littoralis]
TNSYANFCAETTNPSPLQEVRHKKKKWMKGFQWIPTTENKDKKNVADFQRHHLYGVIGILVTGGLTQKRRFTNHWGVSPDHDYSRVRECMPRDLFLLFYSRFFHIAPPTGKVDKKDPNYDSKHHIRKFEEALNLAWSKLADPGAWLSYDEQMVKCTSRSMFFIMRYNPKKPIKHGEWFILFGVTSPVVQQPFWRVGRVWTPCMLQFFRGRHDFATCCDYIGRGCVNIMLRMLQAP